MRAGPDEYAALLDNNPTSIYVIDKATYELLYVNRAALHKIGSDHYRGGKCYSFFNGRESPCPWCSVPVMENGSSHIDENYVPPLRHWYRHDVHDVSWHGRAAAAFYITDITELKRRQALDEERFENLYQQVAVANPNAMAIFRLNLTKNTCSDVQSPYDVARRQQESGTVEGYLAACAKVIVDEEIRRDCESRFSLENLLDEFGRGVSELSIEYPIRSSAGDIIWINGVITMMQNSVSGDVEGIAYAVNITNKKINGSILTRIAEEKYDHVGLINPMRHSYELWKKDRALDLQSHHEVNYDATFANVCEHLILPEDRDVFSEHGKLEHIVATLDERGEDSFVYRYIGADGRCVYKQVGYAWLDSQKSLIMETQVDLTPLYEQQIELVKQQHKAELARERALSVESIPSGIGVFDVSGGKVSLNYINKGFYQMLGLSQGELAERGGTDVLDLALAEDRPALEEEIEASMREHRQLVCRFRLLDGARQPRWVEVRANHVRLDESTERFYVAYFDIDPLVRAQKELQGKDLMFRDILSHSEIVHFTYHLREHRYEMEVLPEKYRMLPKTMDGYPESFIRFVNLDEKDAEAYRAMVAAIDSGAAEAECTVYMSVSGIAGWYRVHLLSVPGADGRSSKALGNVFNVDRTVEAERAIADERFRMESLRGIYLVTGCFSVNGDREIALNRNERHTPARPIGKAALAEARLAEPAIDQQNPKTLAALLSVAAQIPDREQRLEFIRTCSHAGMSREYREGNRDVTLEYRRKLGGRLRWVSTRIIMVEEPSTGDVLAFYYTRDVNDEKQVAQITKLAFERNCDYSALLEVAEKTLVFRSASHIDRTFCRAWSVDGENDYEAGVRSLGDRALAERISLASIVANLRDGREYLVTYDWKAQDGTSLRKQIQYQWLDDAKDEVLVVESDITAAFALEQRRAQELQAALDAAESANRAKTEFLSRISHDIRTPIGAIASMTSFAKEDAGNRERLLHDLDRIEASNGLLLSLINDVLDISKIDSGKIELHPEAYPYDEYIASIKGIFEPLCEQRGINLVIDETSAAHGHGVMVDRVRYNQITLNILSNAVKYTPAGGTVAYASHARRRDDGMVEASFEVADTGIGMSEEFQKTMFEPFSQEYSNPGRAKAASGTGLGLSIVKRLVDLMGGTISVQSELGRGTKVTVDFVLPAADVDELPRAASPDSRGVSQKLSGTVLLVEDNPINTEIGLRLLGSFGLAVEHAENGREAVDAFAASAPGHYLAVLMDIQMPVMDGYEATRAIRSMDRPDAQATTIIAMTADAFEQSIRKARKAGIDDYVTKPIDQDRLFEALRKAGEDPSPSAHESS
jgi:signal transduction histidine kinase/CheY-like chemotaxis protein/PAS domain-containing protein